MDLKQTAQLLARASSVDNRRVEQETVLAWHEILEPFDYEQLVAALTLHRRTSTEYLVPAHLAAIVQTAGRTSVPIPPAIDHCDVHEGYILEADGKCHMCTRYPEDRPHFLATGERPAMLSIGELVASTGRTA
ncbi:hypothetical protein [Marisediminicola sp. LYQ134]|uniref:hypothetical protein n=1 Tax=Marisediminicola sp. LYQ134 TaxID=3391061 RepID=UPI003983915E